MKIDLTSVFVDDQEKAHDFYTSKLGFVTVQNTDLGHARLIILASPDEPDGAKLMLEPNDHPAAQEYQKALVKDGIPITSFGTNDVYTEVERLKGVHVRFVKDPEKTPWGVTAVLDDTCGNLIQLHQITFP